LGGGGGGAGGRGLGEEIGGTATGVISRAHDTLAEHVSDVTNNVKENVAKGVDNVKHVSEAVVEGVAPLLETRWQVLQLGSRVTGLVRSAVATVKGEGGTLHRHSAAPRSPTDHGARGAQERGGWGGGGGRDGGKRVDLVAVAEGRATVAGGRIGELVVAYSESCVETLQVTRVSMGPPKS